MDTDAAGSPHDTTPAAPYRIGIDVGGTFTDLVLLDAAGGVHAFKTPSNPADPASGVLRAITHAAERLELTGAALLSRCSLLVHGSTIATNTLLEGKGAKVGLLTTEGFRDSLEIRRGLRRDVWDHREPNPPVLVPRQLRRPVRGRLDAAGQEIEAVDEATVRDAVALFRRAGVESIAICLLHSYRNPVHEHRVQELVHAAWPEVPVSCSADLAPVIGEYERSATVVVNAYVAPRVVPYLRRLDAELTAMGLGRGVLLVQSNGGAISVAELNNQAVQLILSGPAAGGGAIRYFGRDTGTADLVAIEVGGTSCDVTLSAGGEIAMTDQLEVDGQHLMIPAVEIHTVGAGGGTIAHVDASGMLHAGPRGAGARPGPACYGLGGEHPTVTDAQLVLGRLKPGPYAGGAISLQADRARVAIDTHVARPLGISTQAAAAGILRLVEQTIQHAVERVTTERGHNPRRFTLIAAGGAGPLHGVAVARALGCPAVYIPRLAGVFCAFGMCNADIRRDYQQAWLDDLDAAGAASPMQVAYDRLMQMAVPALDREGFADDARGFSRSMDLRYAGQQSTVAVAVDALEPTGIRRDFEARHEQLYGYSQPRGEIEVVNLRLASVGRAAPLFVRAMPASAEPPRAAEHRAVWIDAATGTTEVPVYDGPSLRPGQTLTGPAVIDEATTTILVGTGDRLTVTAAGNYLIHL
ncbi:MAG TPA: hydantoinase/oxoprolinase family protein [Rhodopila sp.]